ncbi:unnamed protein product [Hermetia illucens]|uniref:Uncharacterized protein n=1 Tax=Hermetia illucens TaxID=343691 RepID=A0A7R8UIA4_HERIL|nr:unnamed protein product [Hermetia illucens]
MENAIAIVSLSQCECPRNLLERGVPPRNGELDSSPRRCRLATIGVMKNLDNLFPNLNNQSIHNAQIIKRLILEQLHPQHSKDNYR